MTKPAIGSVGTLKELQVECGDVLEAVTWEDGSPVYVFFKGIRWTVMEKHPKGYYGRMCAVYSDNGGGYAKIDEGMTFRLISRATPEPKQWKHMTPEEKGALLLAAHEGKAIEWASADSGFKRDKPFTWRDCPNAVGKYGQYAYRIKPEPVRETVTMYGSPVNVWIPVQCDDDTHRITFDTIDGKPDCASVKMEEI